ncbi:hypothetical protein [Corynebacterium hadale]|uniref:hypothetical protein n=1 Tax=Corynebacterium hadale TaxID=2026255 RepID=UPI0010554303|nr:hypothetical protein [Corynebacterium hadale]
MSEQLCFKVFEQLPPTGGVSTKRGVRIDRVNTFEYATVELIKADALVVVKSMDNLLGHDLDRCLNIGLVFRPSRPRWQRSGVVVLQKLLVRGVDTTIAIVAESYMERDTLVTGTGIYEDELSELSNPRCDRQAYESWSLASNF